MLELGQSNKEECRMLAGIWECKRNKGMIYGDIQLQTLPLFVMGGNSDAMFLKNLKLRGSLKVSHLENVDSEVFGLNQYNEIHSLGLYWGSDDGCPNINPEGESIVSKFQERKQTESSGPSQGIQYDPSKGEEVLQSLRPPVSLERLLIKGYPGFKFPRWNVFHLKRVDLINCQSRGSDPWESWV